MRIEVRFLTLSSRKPKILIHSHREDESTWVIGCRRVVARGAYHWAVAACVSHWWKKSVCTDDNRRKAKCRRYFVSTSCRKRKQSESK